MSIRRSPVQFLLRLAADERAATAIEYGLIAAIIVIGMIVALIGLADTTTGMWGNVNNAVANAR